MYIKHVTFQSTRLLRASSGIRHFNPQGSREPRRCLAATWPNAWTFQSTRLSRASTLRMVIFNGKRKFQSTRLSRASTFMAVNPDPSQFISIHKALASLDPDGSYRWESNLTFQSTRLSRASTERGQANYISQFISIHKALASLDLQVLGRAARNLCISIHKALASLDGTDKKDLSDYAVFQFTRLSRASTQGHYKISQINKPDFNPQGSREPRLSVHNHL